MNKSDASQDWSASELISNRIAELGDWRGKTLGRMRRLIKDADPGVVEEWKWMNPAWSHAGIVCTGESYKKVVKLTFARGASLKDPARLCLQGPRAPGGRPQQLRQHDQRSPSRGRSVTNICAGSWVIMRSTRALSATACDVTPQGQKTGISPG
jgi:hypothetical protein